MHVPKVIGKKKYIAGTLVVPKVVWNVGIYSQKDVIKSVEPCPDIPTLLLVTRKQSLQSNWSAISPPTSVHNRFAQRLLKGLAVLGVSMIMADGVLTPAQSVLGGIQGLTIVKPDIGKSGHRRRILRNPHSFVCSPTFGTSKLASGFAPVVIIWLFNAVFGIYNLALFDHGVLNAFSPYLAGHYLVRNGEAGWRSLGGVLLAFTCVEALFADLGAFCRKFDNPNIVAGSKHILQYILQLSATGNVLSESCHIDPCCNFASQAMITSTFQLHTQIMKLSYFRNIKTVHTSAKFYGQIYIPIANWLLMVGTVVVTAAYNNTTKLGNAYGVVSSL
ncbi:potassium transporter-domain-containing protein [Lipomyces starkeyi]